MFICFAIVLYLLFIVCPLPLLAASSGDDHHGQDQDGGEGDEGHISLGTKELLQRYPNLILLVQ